MQTYPRRLLVIIGEAALEKPLLAEARELGALGYTLTEVRGSGRGGAREGTWEADRSIEVKIICEATVAERIAARVLDRFSAHYAVTLYFTDVDVLRPEKF